VSQFSRKLHDLIEGCIVTSNTSAIKGVNREAAQSKFFKEVSGEQHSQLTAMSGNHQLSMWLALNVFSSTLDMDNYKQCPATSSCITPEEVDIAHYIGGFVNKKLQDRSKAAELEVLVTLVDSTPGPPQTKTLLAAKSYGRLTKITSEVQCMFVELEQVFRSTFPVGTANMDVKLYESHCLSSEVIQSCFYNATYKCEHGPVKDSVLSSIICLYFKVRAYHKCKTVIDKLRAKTKISSKDRALRSKLAK